MYRLHASIAGGASAAAGGGGAGDAAALGARWPPPRDPLPQSALVRHACNKTH